jgi:hypothetical protein
LEKNEKVYIDLQRHLDSQAIGFPATKKGSELRILKHIFSPKEAEVAACLTYKLEPLETVIETGLSEINRPAAQISIDNSWLHQIAT